MQNIHPVRRTNNPSPYIQQYVYLVLTITIICSAASGSRAIAQSSMMKSAQVNLDHGVAVSGYDVVAYFNTGKPIKGNSGFSFSYNGVVYYFSSSANLETFKKESQKYVPQYGGWCAYAMGAEGKKVEVNPETFKITGGKLYLFYNKYFTNTLNSWNKDEANLKNKADENWQKLTK